MRLPRNRMSPDVGTSKPGQHAQQRALAAPRGPDDREELAFLDIESDILHGELAAEIA